MEVYVEFQSVFLDSTADETFYYNGNNQTLLACHIHTSYAYACFLGVCRFYHSCRRGSHLQIHILSLETGTSSPFLEINTAVQVFLFSANFTTQVLVTSFFLTLLYTNAKFNIKELYCKASQGIKSKF